MAAPAAIVPQQKKRASLWERALLFFFGLRSPGGPPEPA